MTTPAHPGNDYYVNAITHTIQRQSNPLYAAALKGSGWLGPFTWAQAKGAAAGLAATAPTVPGAPAGGGDGITNPLGGIAAIGDFFNRLTQPNTWIRVGEVVAGLLLVYLGLNAVMRDTSAGNAIQHAKETAKKTAIGIGAAVPK
jgi:hypothetical protein